MALTLNSGVPIPHAKGHVVGGEDTLNPYAGSLSATRLETFPRLFLAAQASGLTVVSGTLYLAYFTPDRNFTAANINVVAASTATSVVTSDFALGLYAVNANDGSNDQLTALLGYYQTTVSSTLGTVKTAYGGALTSDGTTPVSVNLVAGTRYALGVLWVGTGTATVFATAPGTTVIASYTPVLARSSAAGAYSVLPTSVPIAAPGATGSMVWGYMT